MSNEMPSKIKIEIEISVPTAKAKKKKVKMGDGTSQHFGFPTPISCHIRYTWHRLPHLPVTLSFSCPNCPICPPFSTQSTKYTIPFGLSAFSVFHFFLSLNLSRFPSQVKIEGPFEISFFNFFCSMDPGFNCTCLSL